MMWQKKCFPAKRDNERGCCSIDDFSSILQQPLLSSVRVGFPLKGINFESLLDQVYHKQKSTHHEMSVFYMVTRMGFEPMNASVKGW